MNESSPTVSVILPVWNGARFLPEALASVAAQRWTDYEVLVVDDGSTDDSAETARSVATRDGRVRVLSQPHAGLSAARNTGIRRARGRYVGLLDVDDLYLPDKLERQVGLLERDPALGFVYSDYLVERTGSDARERFHAGPTGREGTVLRALLNANRIQSPTILVRRSVFADCGPFDETLTAVEDYDMWLRVAVRHAGRHDPHPVAVVRLHDANMSRDRRRMADMELRVLHKLVRAEPELARGHRQVLRRRFARLLCERGYAEMVALDTAAARRDCWAAIRRDPTLVKAWAYAACCLLGPSTVRRLRQLRGRGA